ncbi:MAG: YrzE family protein [Actinomycetota bacterium]|nr:YrzE family protein [Actinomycetota bacterium]
MTVAGRHMTYASTMTREEGDPTGRTLIRWSAVFAGTLLGLATLALLSSLWLALARASNVEVVQDNIEWFVGGSAVFCLFLAGLLAGYLSGVRGGGTGFLHGATIWGLLLFVTLSIGIPAILNVFNADQLATDVQASATTPTDPALYGALWGTFWTILGGFIAAGLGGAIGGAMTRDADRTLDERATMRAPVFVEDDGRTSHAPVAVDEDARSTR